MHRITDHGVPTPVYMFTTHPYIYSLENTVEFRVGTLKSQKTSEPSVRLCLLDMIGKLYPRNLHNMAA